LFGAISDRSYGSWRCPNFRAEASFLSPDRGHRTGVLRNPGTLPLEGTQPAGTGDFFA